MIDRLRKKPTETHLQAKKRVFREGLVTRFPSIDAAIAAIKSKRPKNKIREKMIETVREGEVEIYEIKGSNEFYVNFSDSILKKVDYEYAKQEKIERRNRERDSIYTLQHYG